MAFTILDRYTAQALEKGLSSAIKAGDCRFQSYGTDNKKKTADDINVGPVAYVVLNDPKNEDPVVAREGTVTKIFFNGNEAKFETVQDPNAVAAGRSWVEECSLTLAALTAKYPV